MGVQSSDLYPRERLSFKDETLKYDPCNLAVIQSIIIVTIVYRHERLPKYMYDFRTKMMEMRKLFQGRCDYLHKAVSLKPYLNLPVHRSPPFTFTTITCLTRHSKLTRNNSNLISN